MRRVARFVVRPLVVGPLVIALMALAVGAFAFRGRSEPSVYDARPTFDPRTAEPEIIRPLYRSPTPEPSPTPTTPTPTPKPKPKPAPVRRVAGPSLAAFRGLGSWVDLYDYEFLEPESSVADMAARGVKTLYFQTARWNKPAPDDSAAFQDKALAERWLTAAHAHGMKVVGWYLPAYDDMSRDVRRTRA